jgi:hypothetical protein
MFLDSLASKEEKKDLERIAKIKSENRLKKEQKRKEQEL